MRARIKQAQRTRRAALVVNVRTLAALLDCYDVARTVSVHTVRVQREVLQPTRQVAP